MQWELYFLFLAGKNIAVNYNCEIQQNDQKGNFWPFRCVKGEFFRNLLISTLDAVHQASISIARIESRVYNYIIK